MKKIIYQMLVGCYIVAALVLVCACNSQLDIQTRYPFTVETMPVPKKLKVNETAEIRCELKRDGRWEDTRYTIRWFLYDGKGTLKLDDGTVLLPNDRYPLEKETFRLYFTSQSDEQSSLKVWVEDSFGQTVELELPQAFPLWREDGTYAAKELAGWFQTQAETIGRRFDRRNSSHYFEDDLAAALKQCGLPDSETERRNQYDRGTDHFGPDAKGTS